MSSTCLGLPRSLMNVPPDQITNATIAMARDCQVVSFK